MANGYAGEFAECPQCVGKDKGVSEIYQTNGCAFSQLQAYSGTSKEHIKKLLERVMSEQKKECCFGHNNKGATGLFNVVSPSSDGGRDQKMIDIFLDLGFREAMTFPRRVGYPKGDLTLMLWKVNGWKDTELKKPLK